VPTNDALKVLLSAHKMLSIALMLKFVVLMVLVNKTLCSVVLYLLATKQFLYFVGMAPV